MKYRTRSKKLSWMVDQDYTHELNSEDAAFLDAFNRGYYGGDFKPLEKIQGGPIEKSIKSQAYNQQYRQKLDVFNNYKTIEISTLQTADIIDEN